MVEIGRDVYDMKEHEWFLFIHTWLRHLRKVENYINANHGKLSEDESSELDKLKNNLVTNVNLGISFLKFPDTIIKEDGELIPGPLYIRWHEKWRMWLDSLTNAQWADLDKCYTAKEDISQYLPDWYKLEEK